MVGFTETITVYNTLYNAAEDCVRYYRTEIKNCSWFGKRRANPKNGGLSDNKEFMVRILLGVSASSKSYVPPKDFTTPDTQYTLDTATVIVKGSGPPAPTCAKERGALIGSHTDAFTVLSVHDNRKAWMRHLYIEGK